MQSNFSFPTSRPPFPKRARDAPAEAESGFSDILDEFNRIQKENAELAQAVRLEKYRRDEADSNLQKLQNRFNDLSAVILQKEKQLSTAKTQLELAREEVQGMQTEIQRNRTRLQTYEENFEKLKTQLSDAQRAYQEKLEKNVDEMSHAADRTHQFFLQVYDFDAKLLKPRDVEIDFESFVPEEERTERESSRDAAHAKETAELREKLSAVEERAEAMENERVRATELKRKYYGQLSHLKQVLKESYNINVTIDPYDTDAEVVNADDHSRAATEATLD